MNNEDLNVDLVLEWLKVNSDKYFISTFENDSSIYYLLDDGSWQETDEYGFHGCEASITLAFYSKVFDSIEEAENYVRQNGVYSFTKHKILSFEQIQALVDESKELLTFGVCINKIPNYEEIVSNNNISDLYILLDILSEEIYGKYADKDFQGKWIEFDKTN